MGIIDVVNEHCPQLYPRENSQPAIHVQNASERGSSTFRHGNVGSAACTLHGRADSPGYSSTQGGFAARCGRQWNRCGLGRLEAMTEKDTWNQSLQEFIRQCIRNSEFVGTSRRLPHLSRAVTFACSLTSTYSAARLVQVKDLMKDRSRSSKVQTLRAGLGFKLSGQA